MIITSSPAPLDVPAPSRNRRRRAPTPETLTMTRLRVLCALHRRNLDGAGAELCDALDTRRDELAATLGMATTDLPMPGGPEQVPRLVAIIEARLAETKTKAAGARVAEAHLVAARLADEAVHGFDGIELDQKLLGELAGIAGYDVIAFRIAGEVFGFGRTFIGALLREVGSVTLTSLRVVGEERSLRVGYEGKRATGWFRLRLEIPDPRRTCVVVDLDGARARVSSNIVGGAP